MPQIDCCIRDGCARSRTEQRDAQRKRYTGPPLHDVGARSSYIVGPSLLLGAELCIRSVRFSKPRDQGSTLKFACGRCATLARINRRRLKEKVFVDAFLSQPRETTIYRGNDYTIIFVRSVYRNHRAGGEEDLSGWWGGARQVFPLVRRSSVFESRVACGHSPFRVPLLPLSLC